MTLKSKKRVRLVGYVLPKLSIEVEKLAKKNKWSFSQVIEEALTEFFSKK